jgi:hypothetical protein
MAWFEGAGVGAAAARLIKTDHQGSVIALTDWSGTGNAPHQHYTFRPGTLESPATARSPTADPMQTQFQGRETETCIKGVSC